MTFLSFFSNPITLTVLTVAAIGYVVYEIVSQQNEREQRYRTSQRPRTNDRPESRNSGSSDFKSYEDITESTQVRRRKVTETKPLAQTKNESREKQKLSDRPKESACNSEFDRENYCQNVFDKFEKDVKNLNKDDDEKKTFHKNILDSDCSVTSMDIEEIKLINTRKSDANQEGVRQNALSSTADVYNQEANPSSYNDPCCSTGQTRPIVMQNDTNTDNSLCSACENKPANVVPYPCKHCSLCIHCARIVYRIYRKCSICESEISFYYYNDLKCKLDYQ